MRCFAWILCALFLSPSVKALPVDPASLLFDAFSSRCESQGKFTAIALRETNALIGVLESLLSDPECKSGLQPVLLQVTNLSADLSFLENGFSDDPKKDLEQRASKLALFLTMTSNPRDKVVIADELTQIQLQMIKYDSEKSAQIRASQARATANLSSYVEVLGKIYASQSACFQRNGILPIQLAGHLMALSGGFFGPVMNASAVLAGRLFASVFDFFQDRKFVQAIKKFRGAKLQAGLSCAIEALEHSICDIQDQRELVRLHENYKFKDEVPMQWRGYDLLQRRYASVRSFLQQVEAGSDPSSDLQGSKRSEFRKTEGSYRATVEKVTGLIGETERKIRVLTESNEGEVAVQQQLNNLTEQILSAFLNGGDAANIYLELLPSIEGYTRMNIWIRTGTPNPDVSEFHVQNPYNAYLLRIQEHPLTLDTIRKHTQSIHEAASVKLRVLKTLVLNPDVKGALSSWTKRSKNLPSAGETIEELILYLDALSVSWTSHSEWFPSAFAQRDQIQLAKAVSYQFKTVLETLKSEKPDAEKVSEIYSAMQLQEQDQVIFGRLKTLVEMDLEKRLRDGFLSQSNHLEISIRLTTDQLFDALFPGSAYFLSKQKQDLLEAEVLSKWNLKNFFDFFRTSIEAALESLKRESLAWREGAAGPFKNKIAKLCALSLNAPQLESAEFKKIVRFCSGTEIVQPVYRSEVRLAFDEIKSKFSSDPDLRLCSFRRFRNQVDLSELLQQRKS